MNFEMRGEKFNIVSEVGLPEDGDFVIALFGDEESGYSWQPAGYSVENHNFYANMGLGGLVLDENSCVAWLKWEDFSLMKIE